MLVDFNQGECYPLQNSLAHFQQAALAPPAAPAVFLLSSTADNSCSYSRNLLAAVKCYCPKVATFVGDC